MFVIPPVPLVFDNATNASADPDAWAVATVYGVGARVARLGTEYASVIDDNVGFAPELENQDLEGFRWAVVGPVNSLAFLDGSPSNATHGTGPMVLEAIAAERFTRIALFDTVCRRCIIEVFNTGGALTGSAEFSIGPEPVDNWLDYLSTIFRSFDRRHIENMSGGAGSKIRITLEGDNVSFGELLAGRHIKVGHTLRERSKVDVRTFTTAATNAFGRTSINKRNTVRDVLYYVHAKRDGFSTTFRILEENDGVRVVTYAADDAPPEMINSGLIEAISLPFDLPEDFKFPLTVKGVL